MYEDLGFTHDECLYYNVSHSRFLEFIKNGKIVSNSRDNNNYGEFRFITILVNRSYGEEAITFYGNGYHEYRETISPNWSFNVGNGCIYRNNPVLNTNKVLKEIESERKHLNFDSKPKKNTFSILADLTDEDGAYTIMQDYDMLD